MQYSIKNRLRGVPIVRYKCPACGSGLTSPITEASQQDTCPDCKSSFVIPGEADLVKYQQQQHAARDAKEKAKADAEKKRKTEIARRRQEADEEIARLKKKAESTTKQCPYCLSNIPKQATKCRYCCEFVNHQPNIIRDNGCLLVLIVAAGLVLHSMIAAMLASMY